MWLTVAADVADSGCWVLMCLTVFMQLTTDQLSLALLDGRSQAMVHFVLGCQKCESGASLDHQLGHFTHTAQCTGAAKPLRKAALEHVLMVQALMVCRLDAECVLTGC